MVQVILAETEANLDAIEASFVSVALKRDWHHKYAKFGKQAQSLFVHSLNAFSVARVIGNLVFELSDDDLVLVCAAAFVHDYQKENESWQDAAKGFMSGKKPKRTTFRHDSGTANDLNQLNTVLDEVSSSLPSDQSLVQYTQRILNMVVYTHDTENRADVAKRKLEVGPIDPLTRVVRLADSIASVKTLESIKSKERDPDIPIEKEVAFDYHEISVVRGVVSCFLNEALVQLMREAGYIPLLYFGSGAVYIRIGDEIPVDEPGKRIRDMIMKQFSDFQHSRVYSNGLANAVIGPLTQMKWPGIELVQSAHIPELVRYISSMAATNKKTTFGDSYYDEQCEKGDEYKKALDDFVNLTRSTSSAAILSEMISDYNVLVYVFDFINRYRAFVTSEAITEFDRDVNEWMPSTLGKFTVDELAGISNRSPAPVRTSAITTLWKIGDENLHTRKDRRKVIEDGCIALLTNVVEKYSKNLPQVFNTGTIRQLLSEIHHLPEHLTAPEDIRNLSEMVYSKYCRGKNETKRLCSLCGMPSEKEAPAVLFGEGSEKFSNTLPGGAKIGGTRKAQVCQLCMFEATLRGFFFPTAPYGTLFILPDMSLSPSAFKLWSDTINATVQTEHLGLGFGKVWNMLRVYKAIAAGNPLNTSADLIRHIRPTNQELKHIVSFLSSMRDSPEEIDIENPDNLDIEMSYESIAKAHFRGMIQIDPYLMAEYTPGSLSQVSSLLTSSYAMTFIRNPPKDDKDEAPSTSAIRTYLLALILSDMFHAKVVFVKGYQPLEQFGVEGRIGVEMPTPAENAMRNQAIDTTVDLHQVSHVLRILTSYVLISMGFVRALGKDRLLRLMSLNRGAILRRAEMEAGGKLSSARKYDLMRLLNNLPPKVGEL